MCCVVVTALSKSEANKYLIFHLEKAASTIKFVNPYNRSHIAYPPIRTTGVPYADTNLPDDDQIEDLEVDQDMRVNMF